MEVLKYLDASYPLSLIKNLHFSCQTHSIDSCLHALLSFPLLRTASVYILGLYSIIWFIFLFQEWVQDHLLCDALDPTVFQAFSDRVIHFSFTPVLTLILLSCILLISWDCYVCLCARVCACVCVCARACMCLSPRLYDLLRRKATWLISLLAPWLSSAVCGTEA